MIASGYQLMVQSKADKRPSLENLWPNVFPPDTPKHSSLTEITGEENEALLLNVIARTILPKQYGGKSSQVILFDLNHKMDEIDKYLLNAMSLNEHFSQEDRNFTDEIVKECLNSIIYISCYSAEQFDLAIEELEDLLWDNENVSLLAIDGLDAFYWDDCYDRLRRMITHYRKLCQRLQKICKEHKICCIYTVETNYVQAKTDSKGKVSNPSKKRHIHGVGGTLRVCGRPAVNL
ncbi:X-ray repair cross complementing 2 isoform X3 [Musca autumnalis]|uniref:X-ray repair cross complementing 2 isoform X3 n=1 Tax=Musca autumnalis TaxID=221902 RepID=UPI003CEC3832